MFPSGRKCLIFEERFVSRLPPSPKNILRIREGIHEQNRLLGSSHHE